MSSFNELINKCMKLTYSNSVNLSDEIYKATATDLKKLWLEYGYANILGALAGLWSFDKATTFFTHDRKFVREGAQSINVVATSYHKAFCDCFLIALTDCFDGIRKITSGMNLIRKYR